MRDPKDQFQIIQGVYVLKENEEVSYINEFNFYNLITINKERTSMNASRFDIKWLVINQLNNIIICMPYFYYIIHQICRLTRSLVYSLVASYAFHS